MFINPFKGPKYFNPIYRLKHNKSLFKHEQPNHSFLPDPFFKSFKKNKRDLKDFTVRLYNIYTQCRYCFYLCLFKGPLPVL
jgi:hypothetical protein